MRAQSSIEFLTMVGLFMIVFLTFFAVMGDRMLAFNTRRQADLADDMLYFIESEILMAAEAHDGFQHNFTLPEKLGGDEYNLTLNASGQVPEIMIQYLEREYARPVLVNMSGNAYLRDPGFAPNKVWREDDIVYVNG